MRRWEFIAGVGNAAELESAAAWPSIFILLAVSGMSGFIIGKTSFSWHALIVAGAVLALGAVVFQGQGFTALSGIFTIVGCLVVNQIAYVLGLGFTGARRQRRTMRRSQ
jgi:hypothetical protein